MRKTTEYYRRTIFSI